MSKTKKKDTLGMDPAVHRANIEERIDELDKRIDDLIVDFGDIVDGMQKTLDKICVRMGLPKS
jgi:hypothetical protein